MTRYSLRRTLAIARKEFNHLRRDRLTGGMVAGIPILLTVLFGYAINNDVRGLSAGVVDEANTAGSRELVAAARASQVIDQILPARSPWELEQLIRRGKITVGIVIPPDYERRVAQGVRPVAQLLIDDSDPTIFGTVRGLSSLPAGLDTAVPGEGDLFALRALYNPERRSAVFIVPGLCGVILSLTMVLFTSIAIVRERERGNLELLITTPTQSIELMFGKIVPYALIGYIQITLILLLGVWLFDLPIRGSLINFYIAAGAYIVSILTLGLVISTLAETQFQAFQMTFLTFLPQMLLSGFMFPFDGMPQPVQWLAEVFPLTHFLRIVRGVVLKQAELPALVDELWPLAVFFLVMMTLATLMFRKSLD